MSLLCFHLPRMWMKTNSMAASADWWGSSKLQEVGHKANMNTGLERNRYASRWNSKLVKISYPPYFSALALTQTNLSRTKLAVCLLFLLQKRSHSSGWRWTVFFWQKLLLFNMACARDDGWHGSVLFSRTSHTWAVTSPQRPLWDFHVWNSTHKKERVVTASASHGL